MIYVTMTIAVVLIELMHISRAVKIKYPTVKSWAVERWDNLAVSFVSGFLLCLVFSDITLFIEDYFNVSTPLHDYPKLGGLVLGTSSTPIINKIKSLTKDKLEKAA